VSYYLKGALVALCLDILLRHHNPQGTGLIGLLAAQYQHWQLDPQPLSPHALEHRIRETVGQQWDVAEFFSRYIYGCEDPDFRSILALAGLQAQLRIACALDDPGGAAFAPLLQSQIGLRLEARPQGLQVTLVEPESPARHIGIVPGDLVLAVADEQMPLDRLNHWLRCTPAGTVTQLTWLHDGRVRSAPLVLSPPVADRWEVRLSPDADDKQQALRATWLALQSACDPAPGQ
jgi:predicted metalloprotease with PDZ domain